MKTYQKFGLLLVSLALISNLLDFYNFNILSNCIRIIGCIIALFVLYSYFNRPKQIQTTSCDSKYNYIQKRNAVIVFVVGFLCNLFLLAVCPIAIFPISKLLQIKAIMVSTIVVSFVATWMFFRKK